MQIITNQFSAEFGGHSAGVMNMITKSGSNTYAGAALLVVRPGDLDAIPPLATQKVPFNQQQFGGNVGGPDRPRPRVLLRQLRAPARAEPGVGDLAGGAGDDDSDAGRRGPGARSRATSASRRLSRWRVRYNMVRWKQDNEAGGLQLPGTGLHLGPTTWTRIHNMWTSIVSDNALLNEVRGQWSRYYDLRAAKCDCVPVQPHRLLGHRRRTTTGTWGVIPEDTWDVSDTLSLWRGAHSLKMGGGVTYDVTTQRYLPQSERDLQLCRRPGGGAEPESCYTQAFALVPGQRRDLSRRRGCSAASSQDEWRVGHNLTLNYGVRYDVELVKDIPDWPAPTDKNNVDPRLGFNWDPRGDQKWSVHGGVGRFTQQNPIFTIVKGGGAVVETAS